MANNGLKGFPQSPSFTPTQGATSGSGSSSVNITSSGGVQTQLTVKASDIFALKDPVFLDWKSGEFINQSGMISGPALTAGPAIATFTSDTNTGAFANANSLTLPDGSFVTVVGVSNTNVNNGPTWLNILKYNAKGVLIAKNTLVPAIPSGSSNYVIGFLSLALLSTGNIAVCYSYNSNTTAGWQIVSPGLQTLYTGTMVTTGGNGATMHVQPLTNGGFIALHSKGIDYISAAGVGVSVFAFDSYTQNYAHQDELVCNAMVSDNPLSSTLLNMQPAKLADGGFGCFLMGMTGCTYVKISATGTLVTSAIVASWSSQTPTLAKFAVSATGNIAWAVVTQSVAGLYGVIGQDGAVIKASTAMGALAGSGQVRLIADTAGNFLLYYFNGANWMLRYMTNAGVDVATYPKALFSGITVSYGNFSWIMKLSTGTVFIGSTSAAPFIFYYNFVSKTGDVKTGLLCTFKDGYAMNLSAMVVNDTVYGVATTGAAVGTYVPDQIAFSISNAGDVASTQLYLGFQHYPNAPIRVCLDATGKNMHSVASLGTNATPSGSTIITTIDLAKLMVVQTYNVNWQLYAARLRPYAQGLMFLDTSTTNTMLFTSVTPPVFGVFVKPRATTLIGVAAAAAGVDEPLIIDTKGIFAVSASWKSSVQNFDQSLNVPPGNAGSINNNIINLKGFA